MAVSSKSLAGPGYVILNIMRAMNIIALVMVIVASWVMLVKTFVVSKFFFFDAVSHLVTSLVGVFLITSEIQLFKGYFARNWPLLAPDSGLVTLGSAMVVLGVSILGNLNKEATSQESLGTAFWRIVISAGILVALLGLLNIVASFIFRDRASGISSRQVRSKGAVAVKSPTVLSSSGSLHRSYTQRSMAERQASVRSNRSTSGQRFPVISRPLNFNEQFREYVQPPSEAHKPAETHHQNPYWTDV